jgi:hypothetical protein
VIGESHEITVVSDKFQTNSRQIVFKVPTWNMDSLGELGLGWPNANGNVLFNCH